MVQSVNQIPLYTNRLEENFIRKRQRRARCIQQPGAPATRAVEKPKLKQKFSLFNRALRTPPSPKQPPKAEPYTYREQNDRVVQDSTDVKNAPDPYEPEVLAKYGQFDITWPPLPKLRQPKRL